MSWQWLRLQVSRVMLASDGILSHPPISILMSHLSISNRSQFTVLDVFFQELYATDSTRCGIILTAPLENPDPVSIELGSAIGNVHLPVSRPIPRNCLKCKRYTFIARILHRNA